MTFTQGFAIPPKNINILAYTGSPLYFVPCQKFNHAPTLNDRNYPLLTLGLYVNPIPDGAGNAIGDLWYLARYFPGTPTTPLTADWRKLGTGTSGPIIDIVVPGGNKVIADGSGNVFYDSPNSTITISAANLSNTVHFDLPGGLSAIQGITTDDATVVHPVGGNVTFNGTIVPNATHAKALFFDTDPDPTVALDLQVTAVIAAADVTKAGIAAFNSSQFTVDGTNAGFISLVGGSGPAITGVVVDAHSGAGTSPVIPTGGNITVTGSQVASGTVGTNVIRTDSVAANTYTIEIQRTTAVAATDITKNGVSHFNSAQFTVDANGFVTITNESPLIYTQINFASSPYTVTATDNFISADTVGGAITIKLPNAPTTLREFTIKDRTGHASQFNISVTTVGGVVTIDGQTTYTMSGNFNAINLIFNGTSYEVF